MLNDWPMLMLLPVAILACCSMEVTGREPVELRSRLKGGQPEPAFARLPAYVVSRRTARGPSYGTSSGTVSCPPRLATRRREALPLPRDFDEFLDHPRQDGSDLRCAGGEPADPVRAILVVPVHRDLLPGRFPDFPEIGSGLIRPRYGSREARDVPQENATLRTLLMEGAVVSRDRAVAPAAAGSCRLPS
jgi:hypothetical protein